MESSILQYLKVIQEVNFFPETLNKYLSLILSFNGADVDLTNARYRNT